jgi:hypothetical protein
VAGSQDASGKEFRLLGRTHIFEDAGVGSWVDRSNVLDSDTSISTRPLGKAPDLCCACSCLLTFEQACYVASRLRLTLLTFSLLTLMLIVPSALCYGYRFKLFCHLCSSLEIGLSRQEAKLN